MEGRSRTVAAPSCNPLGCSGHVISVLPYLWLLLAAISFLDRQAYGEGDLIDDCIDYLPIRTFKNFVLPPDEGSAPTSAPQSSARRAEVST